MTDPNSPALRLNDLSYGYQHSVVLLTACNINLFETLKGESLTAEDIAQALVMEPRGIETLLLALAADGILLQENGRFRIAPEYAPYLLEDSPQTQIHILNHQYNCLQRWVTLDLRLRTGHPVPCETEDGERNLRNFILGMADISRKSSEQVAAAVDLSSRRRLADIGGGPATSSIVLANHYPQLHCTVFDLPAPLEIAREEIGKAGMSGRIDTRSCDYLHDEFGTAADGEPFDVAYISNIIHSLGPQETRMIFDKTYRALAPGGMMIVKDFFLEESRTAPAHGAFFSINMLVATENGRSYTWDETEAMLRQAHFRNFQRQHVAMASGLILATR